MTLEQKIVRMHRVLPINEMALKYFNNKNLITVKIYIISILFPSL